MIISVPRFGEFNKGTCLELYCSRRPHSLLGTELHDLKYRVDGLIESYDLNSNSLYINIDKGQIRIWLDDVIFITIRHS